MIVRIAIALLTLLPLIACAQNDLVEAYELYQAGDLAGAKDRVDRAVNSPAHVKDPEAWLLHGFIHKDLFKTLPQGPEADSLRRQAIESLHRSITYDEEATYAANARQAYEYMVRSYYNDAAKALNAMDAERAVDLFGSYTEAILRLDPETRSITREAEFKNALGTVYTKRFNQDRDRIDQFDLAVEAYQRVLELDPVNYGANYNLATLYYNRGVYNIRNIKADDDIPSIQQIQEVSREYFQSALPYMLKAHDMKPDRRETLIGLEGIYYSLQDQESSDKFRRLFEELPPQEQDR